MWMSSWYDPYPRTATDNYVALAQRKRSPQRLILGPWTHGNNHETFAGDVDFGPAALLAGNVAPDLLTLRLRWFDRWLKGERNGVDSEPAVRIFVMGGGTGRKNAAGRMDHGGRWRAEKHWPLPGTVLTSFYLHGDGGLVRVRAAWEFAAAQLRLRSASSRPDDRRYGDVGPTGHGRRRVRSARESRVLRLARALRALAERADVLVFQTAPLASDVEVTGAIEAELWISSNCPDTDFTIKLIDVYPPNADYPHGFAMNLTDGILRCRYRDSWERPTLMTPGTGLPHQGDGVSDVESVQARSPHSARRLVEQLPALRSQLEHRCAGGRRRGDARGDEPRVRRRAACVARRAARDPDGS